MRAIAGALLACLFINPLGTRVEAAESFPTRPITIVAPFGKGATPEIIGAALAETMSRTLGQKVVFELKPGAGGGLAMAQVEKAAPDGYTIAMISQSTNVFNLSLYKTLPYDPQALIPIVPIAAVANVMTVHPANPAATPLDVVAAARRAPGELTFASGGVGTSHHLSGLLFAAMTGVDIKHVPNLLSAEGIRRIETGELTMGFFNLPTVIDDIHAGKLKVLAVTSPTPSPYLPGAPTLDASGLKGYDMVTWFGFAAPPGTPAAIVQRLHDEFARASADPQVRAKLRDAGLDSMEPLQPAAFRSFIAADVAKWGPIIKAAGVVPN